MIRTLFQYLRFSLVGVGATVTHVAAFVLIVEYVSLDPLSANFSAFISCPFTDTVTGRFRKLVTSARPRWLDFLSWRC